MWMSKQWTFLSHHAHALIILASNPDETIDNLASHCGVTSRSMVSILKDLEDGGYLTKTRVGRNNRYTITHSAPLRHPTSAHRTVGDLIAALGSIQGRK
jgi:DNA-binding MarR family transcriptional regulator